MIVMTVMGVTVVMAMTVVMVVMVGWSEDVVFSR